MEETNYYCYFEVIFLVNIGVGRLPRTTTVHSPSLSQGEIITHTGWQTDKATHIRNIKTRREPCQCTEYTAYSCTPTCSSTPALSADREEIMLNQRPSSSAIHNYAIQHLALQVSLETYINNHLVWWEVLPPTGSRAFPSRRPVIM